MVIRADLGGNRLALDEERFLLVLSSSLSGPEQMTAAREAFGAAGADQSKGLACLCGHEPAMPGSGRTTGPRSGPLTLAAAAVVWFVVHTIMSVQGFW